MARSFTRIRHVDQRPFISATLASLWLESSFVYVRPTATGLDAHQNAYQSRGSIDPDLIKHEDIV